MASQVNSIKHLENSQWANVYPSKTLSKNCRGRNTSKLILRGHCHPDPQNQRQYKKRKLQANITDKHRWENPQQNFSKQNSATHQKAHTLWPSKLGLFLECKDSSIDVNQSMWYTILTN